MNENVLDIESYHTTLSVFELEWQKLYNCDTQYIEYANILQLPLQVRWIQICMNFRMMQYLDSCLPKAINGSS
jgi:hypothetical protein